jgi:hypothetical protein
MNCRSALSFAQQFGQINESNRRTRQPRQDEGALGQPSRHAAHLLAFTCKPRLQQGIVCPGGQNALVEHQAYGSKLARRRSSCRAAACETGVTPHTEVAQHSHMENLTGSRGAASWRPLSRFSVFLGLQLFCSEPTFQASALVWVGWGVVNPGGVNSETTTWI